MNSTGVDLALEVVSVFLLSISVSSAFSASFMFLSSAVLANLFSRFQKGFFVVVVFFKKTKMLPGNSSARICRFDDVVGSGWLFFFIGCL